MANKLPEYFDPIAGQINVRLLATKRVAVIGLGAVGSPIAADLAKHGVGSFLLIDGDVYEERNRSRHPLLPNYRGENKATAVRQHLLSLQVPVSKDVKALPRYVDEPMTDSELDALLDPVDLIVAATGEREVQQRIARRALALDIPVVLPSLYAGGGGEVFIQTSPRRPCFFCLDGFRPSTEPVRGAEALAVDLTAVIATAIELSYRVLDPDSRYGGMTTPKHDEPDQRPYRALRTAPGSATKALCDISAGRLSIVCCWPLTTETGCDSGVASGPACPRTRKAVNGSTATSTATTPRWWATTYTHHSTSHNPRWLFTRPLSWSSGRTSRSSSWP